MWKKARSIQSRLTLHFIGVFAAVLIVVCGGLLIARDRDMCEQFDDGLRIHAEVVCDALARNGAGSESPATQLRSFRFPDYYLQLRNAEGVVVAKSASLAEQTLPLPDDAVTLLKRGPVFETLEGAIPRGLVGESGELRMLTVDVDSTPQPHILQLALSTAPLLKSWTRLRNLVVGGSCLGLLVGATLAWWMARRNLAPLSQIVATAERFQVEDLSMRFDAHASTDDVKAMLTGLNRMLDRFTSSFRSHERFIADVAHELKTPLALLLSEAQVLAQSERSPIEYERFLSTVQDEVRALSQVVESLLMLARAEGGLQVSMTDAPVNEFVMAAVERTAHIASRVEVNIVPTLAMPEEEHDALLVHGDHALLSLAVTNLLRNAIRYAPPQTQVGVTVEVTDAFAVISVRDGGPGIPDEHVPHVFDRFYRVPDEHSTFQGVGLGLAIVKGVVDLHGGEIKVANLPEGGCQFTVRLKTAMSQSPNE